MTITHAEADELLGAYALDALTAAEARRLEEHLAGCPEQAAAAAELRTTQSLLALTAGEVQPPPELRQRIRQAVAANPSQSGTVSGPAAAIVPIRRASRMPRWAPRRAYLAVAAALLVSLGVGGLIGYQLSQSQQPLAYTFQGDPTRAPGADARLVYFRDRQQAVLTVSGLPRLTAGHVYEIWLIKGGVPVDEGISADPNGNVAAPISGDVPRFDQLAITIEPGEQQLPTTTPILIGSLRKGH
ncbi:MAG: anti-sigma factor [Chloroflexi bacterium]|nr:MAG: anti-sigma factor [Chloroflexota bacterium]